MHDAVPAVRFVHIARAAHGVTAFGLDLQRTLAMTGALSVVGRWIPPGKALGSAVPADPATITHLQFTDNLWGRDTAAAGRAIRTTLHGVGGPVVVTLHDLPDPGRDQRRWQRRARVYKQVARLADRIVVCSHHERRRLYDIDPDLDVDVVPNPLPHQPQVVS